MIPGKNEGYCVGRDTVYVIFTSIDMYMYSSYERIKYIFLHASFSYLRHTHKNMIIILLVFEEMTII